MGSPGSGYFELLLAQSRPNYVIPKRNVQCHLMAARSHPSSVVSYRPSTAGKRTVLLGQTRRSTPSHSCDRSVDGRQSLRPAKSTECPRPVYDTGIGPKARDSAERDAVNATAGVVSCSPELTRSSWCPGNSFSLSTIRQSSGTDAASTFRIILLRWTFTVDFGDAHFAGNLLVQPALHDPKHDSAFTRRQCFESRPERAQAFVILAAHTVATKPNIYGIQKILLPERLRQKLDRARLHRLHGHGNVAISGDEDDWDLDTRRGQITLKIQPAPPW